MSYELVKDKTGTAVAITCNTCGLTSHNQNDVEQRYCGNCHIFHDGTNHVVSLRKADPT